MTTTPSIPHRSARRRTRSALRPGLSDIASALTDELVGSGTTPLARSEVTVEVVVALRDLQGSVAAEALPEMAFRLAAYRLSHPVTRGSAAG